jgi:hypothetical protein
MPKNNDRPKKEVKPVLHIFCEGEKTEPNYLNGYIDKFYPTIRPLIKIEPTKKNTPKELVTEALTFKKKSPDWDFFWVAYDRESEQKYTDNHHAQAYDKAQNNTISLAISNVCFEVWLLLHFQETTKPYSNYDDLRDNSKLRNYCKQRGLPDYDKGNKAIFGVLKENEIRDARIRANRINKQTEESAAPSRTKPYQWNPYTGVYKLLFAIDKFASNVLLFRPILDFCGGVPLCTLENKGNGPAQNINFIIWDGAKLKIIADQEVPEILPPYNSCSFKLNTHVEIDHVELNRKLPGFSSLIERITTSSHPKLCLTYCDFVGKRFFSIINGTNPNYEGMMERGQIEET